MNPPEAYTNAFASTQYFMNGQPVAKNPWPEVQPWSYDGDPALLQRFEYPCRDCEKRDESLPVAKPVCRSCCPSILDVTNPANRKGGEYYNSLSDVNHYDDGWTGNAWWGSAQTCATNCGWQQGLSSCQRAPLATQPVLDVYRDYASMAPFQRAGAFGPEHTMNPEPGQPSYLQYYAKRILDKEADKEATTAETALTTQLPLPIAPAPQPNLSNALVTLFHNLVELIKTNSNFQPLQQKINDNIRQIAQNGHQTTANALFNFSDALNKFIEALQKDATTLGDAKIRFYDAASTVAATLAQKASSKESWWQFVHSLANQVEK